jgi:hypothetical protein
MSLLPRPLLSLYRRHLQARTVPAPRSVLLWWGTYGYGGGPTIGDQWAVDSLSRELARRGHQHAVLSSPELGLMHHTQVADIFALRDEIFSIAFVCGPLTDHRALRDFLAIHPRSTTVAAGVSVLENHVAMTRRFRTIVARDGTHDDTFDLALTDIVAPPRALTATRPRVGLSLRGRQAEYGGGRVSQWEKCRDLFISLAQRHQFEIVEIDTRLGPKRRAEDILADFTSVDAVLTTRLHGALFSLAAGRPVIAIDQVPGSAKLQSVVTRTGWRGLYTADHVSGDQLDQMVDMFRDSGIIADIGQAQSEIVKRGRAAVGRAADAIITGLPSQ